MTLHIENAKPGHLALVARLEAAVEAATWNAAHADEGHNIDPAVLRDDRAELDIARRELLALMGAMDDALADAARMERERAALRAALLKVRGIMDARGLLVNSPGADLVAQIDAALKGSP